MTDEKVLKDAQYRKGLSIAFFNATNAAIELTKGYKYPDEEAQKIAIMGIRNWLLAEHRTYWATVINSVGGNYKPGSSIEKLNLTTNYEELGSMWRMLSEDERRDPEVIKVAKELKAKFIDAMAAKDEVPAATVGTAATPAVSKKKVIQKPDEKA